MGDLRIDATGEYESIDLHHFQMRAVMIKTLFAIAPGSVMATVPMRLVAMFITTGSRLRIAHTQSQPLQCGNQQH